MRCTNGCSDHSTPRITNFGAERSRDPRKPFVTAGGSRGQEKTPGGSRDHRVSRVLARRCHHRKDPGGLATRWRSRSGPGTCFDVRRSVSRQGIESRPGEEIRVSHRQDDRRSGHAGEKQGSCRRRFEHRGTWELSVYRRHQAAQVPTAKVL